MSAERVSGRVKWFDNRKGYGFVNRTSDNAEVFVHHSGLKSANGVFRTLYPGEYVEFDIHHDSQTNRDFAVAVTGVAGGPLLCENQETRLTVRRAGRPQQDGFKKVTRRPQQGRRSQQQQQ